MSQPKPTVPEVMPLVQAYLRKPWNGSGGSLHIVLCDGNTETYNVEWCRKYAEEVGDTDGMALADTLLRMSETQRNRICCKIDWSIP